VKNIDIQALCEYAKQFSGLDNDSIVLLHQVYPDVSARLQEVSDIFMIVCCAFPKRVTFWKDGSKA